MRGHVRCGSKPAPTALRLAVAAHGGIGIEDATVAIGTDGRAVLRAASQRFGLCGRQPLGLRLALGVAVAHVYCADEQTYDATWTWLPARAAGAVCASCQVSGTSMATTTGVTEVTDPRYG